MITIISMVGGILGSFFSGRVSKYFSLLHLLCASLCGTLLMVIAYFSSSILLFIIGAGISVFLNGLTMPRVQAVIFGLIPEESMGAIESAIGLVDIVLPSLLSLLAVSIATSLGVVAAAISLIVLLVVALFLIIRSHHFLQG